MRLVVLVEDDEELRGMLTSYLERAGFRILPYSSAGAALHGADSAKAAGAAWANAILVSDYSLPGMNGLELAGVMLREFPAMRCLLLSGFLLGPEMIAGLPLHRIALLQKPFRPAELEAALRKLAAAT